MFTLKVTASGAESIKFNVLFKMSVFMVYDFGMKLGMIS